MSTLGQRLIDAARGRDESGVNEDELADRCERTCEKIAKFLEREGMLSSAQTEFKLNRLAAKIRAGRF